MDLSTFPEYAAFVTMLTTSPQYAELWTQAQEIGLNADGFAMQRIIGIIVQQTETANRLALDQQSRQALADTMASVTTTLLSQAQLNVQPVIVP